MSAWSGRISAEYRIGNLSRAERDALHAVGWFAANGMRHPSQASIADRAKVCVRTVGRALDKAKDWLVSWTPRTVRVGWRHFRVSNAYRLIMPQHGLIQRLSGKRRKSDVGLQVRANPIEENKKESRPGDESLRRQIDADLRNPAWVREAQCDLQRHAEGGLIRMLREKGK
jgi:hypothetical protein